MNRQDRQCRSSIGLARNFSFSQQTGHLFHSIGYRFFRHQIPIRFAHSTGDAAQQLRSEIGIRKVLNLAPQSRCQIDVSNADLPPSKTAKVVLKKRATTTDRQLPSLD